MINGDMRTPAARSRSRACFNGAVDRDQRRPRKHALLLLGTMAASMEPLIVINGDRPSCRRARITPSSFNGAVDRDQRRPMSTTFIQPGDVMLQWSR